MTVSSAGFHDREGLQYCQQCFLTLFASRCQGCSQPILENYISALTSLWHPQCFVCRVSGTSPILQTCWMYFSSSLSIEHFETCVVYISQFYSYSLKWQIPICLRGLCSLYSVQQYTLRPLIRVRKNSLKTSSSRTVRHAMDVARTVFHCLVSTLLCFLACCHHLCSCTRAWDRQNTGYKKKLLHSATRGQKLHRVPLILCEVMWHADGQGHRYHIGQWHHVTFIGI